MAVYATCVIKSCAGPKPLDHVVDTLAAGPSADSSAWVLLTREGLHHVPFSGEHTEAPAAQRTEPAQRKAAPGQHGIQHGCWSACQC